MFKIPKTCVAVNRWRIKVHLSPPPRGLGTMSWPCRVTDSAQRFRDSARCLPLPRQQIFKVPFATHEGTYFIHLGPAKRLLQGRCLVRVGGYCALQRSLAPFVLKRRQGQKAHLNLPLDLPWSPPLPHFEGPGKASQRLAAWRAAEAP